LSYEIIYGKQFIKLRRTREVIPMFLAGSNNCYDLPTYNHRNGRRARDWSNDRYYHRKGKISEKPEIILKNVDAELRRRIRDRSFPDEDKPADVRNRFGYFASIALSGRGTRGTSFNAYRSQYSNGIKAALTIEELDQLGVNLYFLTVTFGDQPTNGIPASVDLKTEAQYFEELKKWRAWQNGNGKNFYLGFHPLSTDTVLDRLRRPGREARRQARREKAPVEQDHYFVLTDGYNNLVRYTRRGYRYSFSKSGGKWFMTEIAAETYRQQLLKRQAYKADIWKVERIEGKATFLV
jgi:hypothetical protein